MIMDIILNDIAHKTLDDIEREYFQAVWPIEMDQMLRRRRYSSDMYEVGYSEFLPWRTMYVGPPVTWNCKLSKAEWCRGLADAKRDHDEGYF